MIMLNNILVATDFGDASDTALTYGRALARTYGATLYVLHVLENDFMHAIVADPNVLEDAVRTRINDLLTDDDGRALRTRAVTGRSDEPAEVIVRYAKAANIDLIVMGTHGRGGVARLLVGSVAERVVRTAPCPVLTVRHPEHEFVLPDDPRPSMHA